MVHVRKELVRQAYECYFDRGGLDKEAVRGATFEDYLELYRIEYPLCSPWLAAHAAPTPELRAHEDRFQPDPPYNVWILSQPGPEGIGVELKGENVSNLETAEIDPAVARLYLVGLRPLSGLTRLRRLSSLRELTLGRCSSSGEAPLAEPVSIGLVDTYDCTLECIQTVLESTRAEKVGIERPVGGWFDVRWVAAHARLRSLSVTGSTEVQGVEHLADLPLEELYLEAVPVDERLKVALRGLSGKLKWLVLGGAHPFGPSVLPVGFTASRLEVKVGRSPWNERYFSNPSSDHRDEWIDYAVASFPEMTIRFLSFSPPEHTPTITPAETYREIEILRVQQAKKTRFEVSGDLTEHVIAHNPGWDGSNGDLEDLIRPLARKAKKRRITWSSEADTFVVQTADVETCRWIIDQVLGLRGLT